MLSDSLPIPAKAVASELRGIATEPDVNVSPVASEIEDAMRNDHAGGPTGEVMVESLKCTPRPNAALAVQSAEELFGFRIDGKYRISRFEVRLSEFVNALELGVTIRRISPSYVFLNLVKGQPFIFEPITYDMRTDWCALRRNSLGNLSGRKICPLTCFVVRVASGPALEDGFQIVLQLWFGLYLFFRPAPGRRMRPSTGS